MRVTALRFAVLCSATLLVGCGEGYVFERTDSFPYNNERTAGTGVAYVLAKMSPKKELKVEPVAEKPKTEKPDVSIDPEPAPPPVLEAEEIFDEEQKKSSYKSSSVKKMQTQKVAAVQPSAPALTPAPVAAAPKVKAVPVQPVKVDVVEPASPKVTKAAPRTAEDYISQAPKIIEVPEVEIVDAEDLPAASSSEFKSLSGAYAEKGVKTIKEQVVETTEQIGKQPAKEIISPKRDGYAFRSVGEEQLNEIYSDPM